MANIKQNQACALGFANKSEIQLAERLILFMYFQNISKALHS